MFQVLKNSPKPQTEIAKSKHVVETPVVLTPSRIEAMLKARSTYQVVKFRSTCSDCVPNL